jgi:hypothetical protein
LTTRTVSPFLHPRPASGGATNFLPASALFCHQQAFRPPGEEDARCVQPTSATQTICVHPHLARSRLTLATFAAGSPHGVLGSAWHFRGPGRFTTSLVASADRINDHVTRALLPHGLETRAWAFCSHGDVAIEPLTLLSRPFVSTSASLAFAGAASSPFARSVLIRCGSGTYGSEDAMDRQDHRGRHPVKSDAS